MPSSKPRFTHDDDVAGALSSGALSFLESHVDFPRVQVQMSERLSESEVRATKEAAVFGSPARLEFILERYDIRAQAYLQLVTAMEMQNAYLTMLQAFEGAAWQELTGFPLQHLRPVHPQTLADLESIRTRTKWWTLAGYRQLADGRKPNAANHSRALLQATEWGNILIEFLSDERIQIRVGQGLATLNYAELGLNDRRSGKPSLSWMVLRRLAEHRGLIKDHAGEKDWSKIEKRVQKLRTIFRSHFRLEGDPLPFIGGQGYQAQFKICTAPSYES